MNDSLKVNPKTSQPIDREIYIAQVGNIAWRLLSENPDASIIGVTSRGVFIRLSSKWVIFLSLESYCGPLTLNQLGFVGELQNIAAGMPVRIDAGNVVFPTIGCRFRFDRASVWQAPPLPSQPLSVTQRLNRLEEVSQELSRMQKHSLFADIRAERLGVEQGAPELSNGLHQTLYAIRMALLERDNGAFTKACREVLGLGAGLTPSGDDLIIGLALALSRWGGVLFPDGDSGDFLAELIPLAYQETSLLSANLIECACQGQADERLLLALDGIMTGVYSIAESAAALDGWGSSSGADALAGMALLLYANISRSP